MVNRNYSKKMMDPKSAGPVRSLLDREPIYRKVINRTDKTASDLRNSPGRALRKRVPKMGNRNIGEGVAVGAIGAAIVRVVKDYVPLDSSVSIIDTKDVQGGTLYTINVDSIGSNIAEAESFFEATTGFTSILAENINIQNVRVMKTRILRDTYEVQVLVES